VVGKGSIAVDGISLTIADRGEEEFTVAIVPETYDVTTLSEKSLGDPVHVEIDVVAKYAEQLLDGYACS
jgi:riboflavin synthase